MDWRNQSHQLIVELATWFWDFLSFRTFENNDQLYINVNMQCFISSQFYAMCCKFITCDVYCHAECKRSRVVGIIATRKTIDLSFFTILLSQQQGLQFVGTTICQFGRQGKVRCFQSYRSSVFYVYFSTL